MDTWIERMHISPLVVIGFEEERRGKACGKRDFNHFCNVLTIVSKTLETNRKIFLQLLILHNESMNIYSSDFYVFLNFVKIQKKKKSKRQRQV